MTGNIWIDQQASFAEIEVAIFAAAPMADELPHISPVGNAMGQRGPRERSTTHSTACAPDHADSDD
jgi:hypothetical protein